MEQAEYGTAQKPPDNPAHRKLWAMGFNADQREAILNFAKATWAAGLDCDPIAFGMALVKLTPMQIVNLDLTPERLTERKE